MRLFSYVSNPLIRESWLCASVQFGKTMVSDVSIAWIIANCPGPVMQILQTDSDAKQHFKMRIRPLWKACVPVARKLPTDRHDAGNMETHFGDFSVLYNGPTESNLQSKSIQWLFVDEAWMEQVAKMMGQARGRITAYEDKGISKLIVTSQAGVEGDMMHTGMMTGNNAIWAYRNSRGTYTPLLFGDPVADDCKWGLRWADDAKRSDGTYNEVRAAETAHYVCKETGEVWLDEPRTRQKWNEEGDWVDQRTDAPAHIRSSTINALFNRPLALLAKEKALALNARRDGNMEPMKLFVQKREARPWRERKEEIELGTRQCGYVMADYREGQKWDLEHDRAMFLDRQQGRQGDVPHWWVHIVAFCRAGAMRTLYFGRVETVEAIRDIQTKYNVRDGATWQDAAHQTPLVYDDCARFGWLAVFGDGKRTGWIHKTRNGTIARPWSPPQKTRAPSGGVVAYFFWSSNYAKDVLANLVEGKGAQFDLPDDLPDTHRAHLKAEHHIQLPSGKWAWEKIHASKDNHMWDTSAMAVVYALAMGYLVGVQVEQHEAEESS
jgi:hypothetical protein